MVPESDELFLARLLTPIREVCEQAPGQVDPKLLLHGTTIGSYIVGKGQYAVTFSDGKVSLGNVPVSMTYRKIFTIDKYSRLLISGSPVLGKMYASAMRSWFGYLQDISDQNLTARAKVKTLSKMLFHGLNLMGAGIICAPIFVTYDVQGKKCARIFSMGADGSELEQNELAAAGSGGGISGRLRDRYIHDGGKDMAPEAGVALARDAIRIMAPEADSFSGGKVSIELIGPDGAHAIE